MPAHRQFEELCALAVTGQISGDAMAMLDRHARQCDECRVFLADMGPLKAHVAPLIAAATARVEDCEPPEGIRERFFERARADGFPITAGPPLTPATLESRQAKAARSGPASWRFPSLRFTGAVAACLACAVAGYLVAMRTIVPSPVVVRLPIMTTAPKDAGDSVRIAALERKLTASQGREQSLSAELQQARSEQSQTLLRLDALSKQAVANADFERQFRAEAQKLQDADQSIASLRASLGDEKAKRASAETASFLQHHDTEEAKKTVAALEAQLERQREIKAASGDFSHLIAARDLHIVDVYDTSPDGRRQRTFGRVFYVEGKSLVFYAYDLTPPRAANAEIKFHVWGETAGVKTVSFNLGVLESEDPKQRRWLLTYDDPKVLARINAVFITADPDQAPPEPRGRKLMYAFLGSPNHP